MVKKLESFNRYACEDYEVNHLRLVDLLVDTKSDLNLEDDVKKLKEEKKRAKEKKKMMIEEWEYIMKTFG